MSLRVLVPMDDSKLAERALRYALETLPDAEITVLHVVGGPSPMMGEATRVALEDDAERGGDEAAEKLLETARDIAAEYDVEIQTRVATGHPARQIVDIAEDFDTVVIGSHGSSVVERLFVGNVTETVFRRCPVPVTVVR
ncbi:Nucleotide-binding protein, UspA family [Halanaeroarchaeum sp. HSR-CO]|uniref:universal stress protein n=1 Tax=Halanaeroarchaeum sp. HSR-CO TaxID=2866382 RepID=UPI00217D0EA3|nr:universal stress protein [Halanaeroarchaeum sp. HSR-CO]UWG48618.1 Nucleotide-binding protein, UspA family [Halanaeroarchaeum sp. HSR-CO]